MFDYIDAISTCDNCGNTIRSGQTHSCPINSLSAVGQTPYQASSYSHCPVCGQLVIGGQFTCGHTVNGGYGLNVQNTQEGLTLEQLTVLLDTRLTPVHEKLDRIIEALHTMTDY